MGFLHINKNSKSFNNDINKLNTFMKKKTNKLFILVYMENCPPCMATCPEWKKLQNILNLHFVNKPNIMIVDINENVVKNLNFIKTDIHSFPTIRFITNKGEISENFEDSNIKEKNRTIDSFIEWINLNSGEKNITKIDKFKSKKKYIKSHKKTRKKYNI